MGVQVPGVEVTQGSGRPQSPVCGASCGAQTTEACMPLRSALQKGSVFPEAMGQCRQRMVVWTGREGSAWGRCVCVGGCGWGRAAGDEAPLHEVMLRPALVSRGGRQRGAQVRGGRLGLEAGVGGVSLGVGTRMRPLASPRVAGGQVAEFACFKGCWNLFPC